MISSNPVKLAIVGLFCVPTLFIRNGFCEIGDGLKSNPHGEKPFFFGTSAFVLINLIPDPPLYFGQLDFGYHLTEKDVFVLEALFWNYSSPMGSTEISGPKYPGSILAYGISLAYQRFFWKGLYLTGHLTPLVTQYSDTDKKFIQSGFQPWFQLRPGYHFKMSFLNPNVYIEPSLELNYWPLNFNVPASFKALDEEHPNYLIAPGLNFGIRF